MKKFLMAVAVLCLGTAAFAGPNAGGTIIAHDANVLVSQTVEPCSDGVVPDSCSFADVEIDGANSTDPSIFRVYAAFPVGSAPRLMGIAWGIHYDQNELAIAGSAMCGTFEINDATWPSSDTGSSVTWPVPQTGLLTPVYWFAAYSYYGNPTLFQLRDNPTQGGFFGDDSVPAILDPITGYGSLGFDMMGAVACPPPVSAPGACCAPDGTCEITMIDECQPPNQFFSGYDTCDPNPCPLPTGACCAPDGTCTELMEVECQGTWMGPLTTCDPNPCPQPGACCAADGSCTMTFEADCQGQWQGIGTVCEPNPCVVVPTQESSWGSIKNIYR